MGYSTCGMHRNRAGANSRGPRTCDSCDKCPKCSGFRMKLYKCPVNYCGVTRFCPPCYAKTIDRAKAYCTDHCIAASARYRAELDARAAAIAAGLAGIKAGVSLPNGNVFAWTSRGNFEVPLAVYRAACARIDHVIADEFLTMPRPDELPAEVYGTKPNFPEGLR
jgi:predicted transcriptional regulator